MPARYRFWEANGEESKVQRLWRASNAWIAFLFGEDWVPVYEYDPLDGLPAFNVTAPSLIIMPPDSSEHVPARLIRFAIDISAIYAIHDN